MTTFIDFLDQLKHQLFPGQCYLCQQVCSLTIGLCQNCIEGLKLNQHACSRCANPLEGLAHQSNQHTPKSLANTNLVIKNSDTRHLCGKCIKQPWQYFDHVCAPFYYEQNMRYLIHQLKYQQKLFLARSLSELFISQLDQRYVQGIDKTPKTKLIAMPIHYTRLQQRGFNQSLEIAQFLAKHLNLTIAHDILFRARATAYQEGLSAAKRRRNVSAAFMVPEQFSFKAIDKIILIDDVMTTGSTVNEAAKTLKQAGAKKVEVWVIAHA